MSDQKVSDAAKALSALGASKGGKARAEKLSDQQRSEIAQKAAQARWEREPHKALFEGALKIGEISIPCYNLSDGSRVLSRIGFLQAIGRKGKAKGGRAYDDESKTPVFLTANNLKSFVTPELLENSTPVPFKTPSGTPAIGYKAELLPEVCKVFIGAAMKHKLHVNQEHIAEKCKLLLGGFATVGIIALVDEATGYQDFRNRDALQKILEAYIAKEFLPWTRRFSPEFYKEMFRLRKWEHPESMRRPRLVGLLTEQIVYKKLPKGVLEELKAKNPKDERGRRKRKHHQHLTEEIGNPHLDRHLAVVTALMRASKSWDGFKRLLDRAVPNPGHQPLLIEDMYDESDEE